MQATLRRARAIARVTAPVVLEFIFVRSAGERRWVRIDGFASADELADELHGWVAVH